MTGSVPLRVLLADDHQLVRKGLRALLEELDFVEVIGEAANGKEAINLLRNGLKPQIALLDYEMPVMDGLEFIQAVRRQSRWNAVRIVMVTTETESEQVQRAMTAGANEYIMKPFTPEVLVAKLSLLGAFED